MERVVFLCYYGRLCYTIHVTCVYTIIVDKTPKKDDSKSLSPSEDSPSEEGDTKAMQETRYWKTVLQGPLEHKYVSPKETFIENMR